MVTQMKKVDAVEELRRLEVEGWKPEDTVVELKAILREALKRSSQPKAEFMKGHHTEKPGRASSSIHKDGSGKPRGAHTWSIDQQDQARGPRRAVDSRTSDVC